jgi:dTDP-4-dehydrorhamnose 3,5-epimerase
MPATFTPLQLEGLWLIEPRIFSDPRGYFFETFKQSELAAAGLPTHFVQENHSSSAANVLRGLHYQRAPRPQGKLVRALHGAIYDVVVDMRQESPTCGQWLGVELSAANRKQLYIPPGFAHGFCVLGERAEIAYLCTSEYSPEHEAGVIWDDPTLGIDWPVKTPLLSDKDKLLGSFTPLPASVWRGENQ